MEDDRSAPARLGDLLVAMFDKEDLRQFLLRDKDYERIAPLVSWDRSEASVALDVAHELYKRRLVDAEFRAKLTARNVKYQQEIDGIPLADELPVPSVASFAESTVPSVEPGPAPQESVTAHDHDPVGTGAPKRSFWSSRAGWITMGAGGVIVLFIVLVLAFGDPYTRGDDDALDTLWDACATGDLGACDELYDESPEDSEYRLFGSTCGDLDGVETFGGCLAGSEE